MRFSEYPFHQVLHDQIARLGFKKPTDIQFKSIQHILKGEDVFAVAQTGTGKTAAFAIPIINKLIGRKKSDKNPACLVLAPTRELAEQITKVFIDLAKDSDVRIAPVFGGVGQENQITSLKKGTDILVATPGRIFDLRAQGYLSLDNLRFLVLDEADRMLDLGFADDVKALHKLSPKTRQTLFFSATITKKVKSLAYDIVRDAIRIQVSPRDLINKNIDHAWISVEMDDKRFFLENMLKEYPEFKFVVFVRTKVRAERVVAAMERAGLKTEAIHGGKEQTERFEVLDRFRSGENTVLVTTDVSARGIDIPNVDCVINYDVPEDPEQYVHRIGRTGRGTKRGQAITFCSEVEKKLLEQIEEYIDLEVEQLELSKSDYSTILFDAEDPAHNWQKLLDEDNEEFGTDDTW